MDTCHCPIPITDVSDREFKPCLQCGLWYSHDTWAKDTRVHQRVAVMRWRLEQDTERLVNLIMER